MNYATVLLTFAEFLVRGGYPDAKKQLCKFWTCGALDLGPMPPSLQAWQDFDAKIDKDRDDAKR